MLPPQEAVPLRLHPTDVETILSGTIQRQVLKGVKLVVRARIS